MAPEKEVGPRDTTPEGTDTNPTSHHPKTTAGSSHSRRGSRRGGGLAVRRATALRKTPLGSCACNVRDPDVDRHRCRDEEPTEKQIDAYADALEHLRDLGLTPAALLPELRLLWSRGGQDRRLAVEVAQDWGLVG